MSFVVAAPDMLAAPAADLARINSALSAVNAAASAPTTALAAAAEDEVSAAIAALFGSYGEAYQTMTAQVAGFPDRFVQALAAGAGSYASTEAANAAQNLLNAVNAPTQALSDVH
ncbi:hypothetical protein MLAC_46500 [Mycobacterium lacus]|uniref:PE domain-containing protein n=1 Tax=Mycobacterium lacus TaxID=169765 RepID=A0A7I7NRR0_9MYCO|nr:PE family protein [Mycobacterium lacus]BBX99356.1 hypothetical protein MLAC_46500 [Mycobacterium lacus]